MSRFKLVNRVLTSILIFVVGLAQMYFSTHLASATDELERIQIDNWYTFEKVIHDPRLYSELIRKQSRIYSVFNGRLVYFDQGLNIIESKIANYDDHATLPTSNGGILGFSSCYSPTIGATICNKVVDIVLGQEIGKIDTSSLEIETHEFEIDQDGNYWFIDYPITKCSEISQICEHFGLSKTEKLMDCKINQVSPKGARIYSWSAQENLSKMYVQKKYRSEVSRGTIIDLFHCNSVDVIGENSILVSLRNSDSIILINKRNSKVEWKLGGAYIPGVSLIPQSFDSKVSRTVTASHDARYVGDSMYSYFDNRSHVNLPARGVVFEVNVSGGRSKAILRKSFVHPFNESSLCQGSLRKLPGDYWIVGWGCNSIGATVYSDSGAPIVSIRKIKTKDTEYLFPNITLVFNGVDWWPSLNYGMGYRFMPLTETSKERG